MDRLEHPDPSAERHKIRTAIALHRLGWSLVPLERATKVALVPWKHLQVRRATLNQLGRWMVDEFPGSNYGVITGAVSGVVAVEADDAEAVEVLERNLPRTPLRQRARRGQHWLYRHPGGRVGNRVRCSVGGKEHALDLRGDGGLIVGPGSVHASGHVYSQVEPWTAEALAATPVFDPAWLDPPRPRRRGHGAPLHLPGRDPGDIPVPLDARVRKARHWLRTGWHGDPVPGTRQGEDASGKAFWIALRLVHGFGLTPEEALPLFAEWGRRDDQRDEDGGWFPWDESELLHKLSDADGREEDEDRPRGWMLGLVHPPPDMSKLKGFAFKSRM